MRFSTFQFFGVAVALTLAVWAGVDGDWHETAAWFSVACYAFAVATSTRTGQPFTDGD